MQDREEQGVKILDIFNFPLDKKVLIVDCAIEPKIGDFLLDENQNLVCEITGIVINSENRTNSNPVIYLDNKRKMRSISITFKKNEVELNKGDVYYIISPPSARILSGAKKE